VLQVLERTSARLRPDLGAGQGVPISTRAKYRGTTTFDDDRWSLFLQQRQHAPTPFDRWSTRSSRRSMATACRRHRTFALMCTSSSRSNDARIGFPRRARWARPPGICGLYHCGPQWSTTAAVHGGRDPGREAAKIGLVQKAVPRRSWMPRSSSWFGDHSVPADLLAP